MLVSLNWLQDYVEIPSDIDVDALADLFAFSGLNFEGAERSENDVTFDLEVTSNRPDCLGHIGVAREAAVLCQTALHVAEPRPQTSSADVSDQVSVEIKAPELCRRYTGRLIRGVTIGPSPAWLVNRLAAVGMASVNNVVDITNYVLMECGQPLHAFDFAKVRGGKIIVREAVAGETFQAIDHKEYKLTPGMCVIADAERPVALAGVMGGADSEISDTTTDILIESADFAQLSVRTTARALNLHSPSSFRFERGVDPAGIDWASRRCCELILELAGGELCDGVADVERPATEPAAIPFRTAQLERVLGYTIPRDETVRILGGLGMRVTEADEELTVTPPTWRKDVTREIDLVEEVARIYGYDKAPPVTGIKLAASSKRPEDRTLDNVRRTMTALGFFEAITRSVVDAQTDEAFHPWSDEAPLLTDSPMILGADRLRRSVLPSLLNCLQGNEASGNFGVRLFETGRAYCCTAAGAPEEHSLLSVVAHDDFLTLKGALETVLRELRIEEPLRVEDRPCSLMTDDRSVALQLGDSVLGYLGEVSEAGREPFGLRRPASVLEVRLDALHAAANLTPVAKPITHYPAVEHDVNLIVDEAVRWADIEEATREATGDELVGVAYRETFRSAERDGPGRKRLLFTLTFQAADRTLTGTEAEGIRDQAVTACEHRLGAKLAT